MSGDDIFVKRVDFEENNNHQPVINSAIVGNGGNISDVEKLAEPVKSNTCASMIWTKVKPALSHIGLLVSLGLFCLGGGWVKKSFKLFALSSGFYH